MRLKIYSAAFEV